MKIFITGASGFVGGAVAKHLKNQHTIIAMARSERSAEKVRVLGVTPVHTALNQVTVEDLAGCDVVIHSGAYVEQWGTRQQFWDTNVEGTRQLLEVAKQAGVKRFIHISTEAVLFDGTDMVDIDESHPYPKSTSFLYSETKQEAEKLVLAANEDGAFETISLRPCVIWGPEDQTILPEVMEMVNKGAFMWGSGGKSITSHIIKPYLKNG